MSGEATRSKRECRILQQRTAILASFKNAAGNEMGAAPARVPIRISPAPPARGGAELTGENQVGRAVRLSTVDGLNRAEFAA
jgi:hypothetical protein